MLVLINGAPASGKSTLARRWAEQHPMALALDVDVVRGLLGRWLDDPTAAGLAARAMALQMARVHLQAGHDVVVPQLLGRLDLVIALERLAAEVGVPFVEVMLVTDTARTAARLAERSSRDSARPEHADNEALLARSGGSAGLGEVHEQLRQVVLDRPRTRTVVSHEGQVDRAYRDLVTTVAAATEREPDDRAGAEAAGDDSPLDEPLWSVYEQMGDRYRRHAEDGTYNAYYDRPAVLDTLGPVAGRRVLDAACGPGLYTEALLAAGAEVAAFDASQVMVGLARGRVGDRARIDVAALDATLPYPDGTFDLAVCALAIHYVQDRAAAFAELHRVLRPGGALVVSTQHPTSDWLRKGGSYFARVLESDRWDLAGRPQTVRFWREPLSDLCAAATDGGFLIERLVEPRPVDGMRTRSPADHARLSREPGFLVLRLLRP